MGRQLQLATTWVDELSLLRFVNEITPVRVFGSFSPTREGLWLNDWSVIKPDELHLHIWPIAFPWNPEYLLTRNGKLHYVCNTNMAPILELCRSDLAMTRYGRLYWAHKFSATSNLEYDEIAFSRLVDEVFKWIRKVGRKFPEGKSRDRYCFPDAIKRHPWLLSAQVRPDL